jgi:hypothetical protein
MRTHGPYELERDTDNEPLPREARSTPAGRGVHQPINRRHLTEACRDAGVVLGAHDARILAWLANYEPSTVQVVIGLISRAHTAGVEQERTSTP